LRRREVEGMNAVQMNGVFKDLEKKCTICNTIFIVRDAASWAYKQREFAHQAIKYQCRYSCFMKEQSLNELAKTEWKQKLKKKRKEKILHG
jgi:hypothetical protein